MRLVCRAERLPQHVLAQIFQYLPLADFLSSMLTCRNWFTVFEYDRCGLWRSLCERTLPENAITDVYLLVDLQSYKAKVRAFVHAWNPSDCSRNAFIKTNGFTMHRNPIAQSTDGVRGKRGFQYGRHAWEIWWEGPLGTLALIGVCTKHAALQVPGYVALLGSDEQGWGWNLVDNSLQHDGKALGEYPLVSHLKTFKYQMGEKIRLILDCDLHLIYFERGSTVLGIAFTHLPPVKLFPCVVGVYGNTQISMVYLGSPVDG